MDVLLRRDDKVKHVMQKFISFTVATFGLVYGGITVGASGVEALNECLTRAEEKHVNEGTEEEWTRVYKSCSHKAEEGDAVTWVAYGGLFSIGGNAEDQYEARQWFEKAAKAGNKAGQAMLAQYYYFGNGGAQDHFLAYMWANIAVENGAADAEWTRDKSASDMTPEQLLRAQKRSRQCVESGYQACGYSE